MSFFLFDDDVDVRRWRMPTEWRLRRGCSRSVSGFRERAVLAGRALRGAWLVERCNRASGVHPMLPIHLFQISGFDKSFFDSDCKNQNCKRPIDAKFSAWLVTENVAAAISKEANFLAATHKIPFRGSSHEQLFVIHPNTSHVLRYDRVLAFKVF